VINYHLILLDDDAVIPGIHARCCNTRPGIQFQAAGEYTFFKDIRILKFSPEPGNLTEFAGSALPQPVMFPGAGPGLPVLWQKNS